MSIGINTNQWLPWRKSGPQEAYCTVKKTNKATVHLDGQECEVISSGGGKINLDGGYSIISSKT